jgi:phosphate transport system substrate-binding protein
VSFALFSAACGGDAEQPERAVVHVDGSNGVMPLAKALADAFVAATPDVRVTFGEGIGSRSRLDSLRAGVMDIAIASHGLDTAALRAEGLMVVRFAETPVVIGVNAASVSLADIRSSQLCDALAGRTTSWRALGDGRDLAVALVVRPESEVDMEVLRDRVPCARDVAITSEAHVVEETADMARALRESEGALGITTATVAEQSDGEVRALALDGVMPTPAAVRDGRYALVRSSYFVMRADASEATARFLAFVRSDEARVVLEANGAVAVGG